MADVEELASVDLLEPEVYPDASSIRVSLANTLTIQEQEMINELTSNKATLRAIAPYLQVISRSQKKKIKSEVTTAGKAPKIVFERKSKDEDGGVIPNILEKADLIKSIQETGETLKTLVRCNRFVIYFVDPTKNEIFQLSVNRRFPIGPGSTLAGYSAYTKLHVVSANVREDRRFPVGLGFENVIMKYGLCVPIKTPNDNVLALFEFNRDAFDVNFNEQDIQRVLTTTSWMGVAIHQLFRYTSLKMQSELTNYLQELVLNYHCMKSDFNKVMSDIVLFARETIGADECVLYVVRKYDKGIMEVEIYVENPKNHNVLIKKLKTTEFESDGTLLSRVMIEKEIVNDEGDENVLFIPVTSAHKDVVAAIRLNNHDSSRVFNEEDEKTLRIFANYFSIIVPFVKKLDQVKKVESRGDSIRHMLHHHMKPLSYDREVTKQRCEKLPDHFFTFSWYPSPDDTHHLVELTVNMFNEVLGSSFMSNNNVPRFVLTVKNCYRPNPYHNFLHAFAVTHTMAIIVRGNHHMFNGIERQALMVAALCHDVDHRGYNNSFVQLTNHYLSSMYESSPLENHHFAVAKMIIEQCFMFRHIRKDIYNKLIEEIHKCILATDLSLYFQTRTELVKIADTKAFTFKDPKHRRLIKSLLMTTCDLSGQSKPIDIAIKITKHVYEEFFQQGDVEKKLGYVPLPTMDRDKEDTILDSQIQFLNVVVIPCVEIVSRIFTSVSPMLEDTKETLKGWKELLRTDRTKDMFTRWKEFAKHKKRTSKR